MADPIKYVPDYSYTGFQTARPNDPLPADRIDADLADIATSISQSVDAIKDIRRSDGKLKNGIVTKDSLGPGLVTTPIGEIEAASVLVDPAVAGAESVQAALEALDAALEAIDATVDALATVASTGDYDDLLNKPLLIGSGFDTKADAEAYAPAVAPGHIRTEGYAAPGDGGGALYTLADTEPGHAGKLMITLADAVTEAWYEIANDVLHPEQFGDCTVSASAPMQAALDCINARGGGVLELLPDRVYLLGTVTSNGLARVYSNTTIRGPRSAVVKVADNTGDYGGLFLAGEAPIRNVVISGFTIDQNAAGNTTADITAGNAAKSAMAVNMAANPQCVYITHLRIINAPGVNTISLNGADAYDVHADDNSVSFIRGASTTPYFYDNSVIYINAAGFSADRNYIENLSVSGDSTWEGGVTAVEVHGRNGSADQNVIRRFQYGINVVGPNAAQDSAAHHNISCSGNKIMECRSGIALWALTSSSLKGCHVRDNLIVLAPASFRDIAPGAAGIMTVLSAVVVAGAYVAIDICDNVIQYLGDYESSTMTASTGGILVEHQGTAADIRVLGNRIYNAPNSGIRIRQVSGAFTGIAVEGNLIVDAGRNSLAATKVGIIWLGVVTLSTCRFNICRDTGATILMTNAVYSVLLSAGSQLLTKDNFVETPNSASVLTNRGGASDAPERTSTLTYASSMGLNSERGIRRFIVPITSTGANTITVAAVLYPVATGEEIDITIINTSGGTTNTSWVNVTFSSSYTQLTSGQRCFLKLRYDGVAGKWYQCAPQIIVTS